ncbi:MAG: hypothetical protein ACRDP8_27025 [Actinopolymorphaceae bacterium]
MGGARVFDHEAVLRIARRLDSCGEHLDDLARECPATVEVGALSGEVMVLMAALAEAGGELADRLHAVGDNVFIVAINNGEVEAENLHSLWYAMGGTDRPRRPVGGVPDPFTPVADPFTVSSEGGD